MLQQIKKLNSSVLVFLVYIYIYIFAVQRNISCDHFGFPSDMCRPLWLKLKYLQVIPWLYLPVEGVVEGEREQPCVTQACGPPALGHIDVLSL